MSALDHVRAARAELTAAVRRADTNLSYERGLLNEVDRHLAQAEADLAREEKTGGRSGTTAAGPAQAPEPTDPGSTPGTGSPRPDAAGLGKWARQIVRDYDATSVRNRRVMLGQVAVSFLPELADALEAQQRETSVLSSCAHFRCCKCQRVVTGDMMAEVSEGIFECLECAPEPPPVEMFAEAQPAFTEEEHVLIRNLLTENEPLSGMLTALADKIRARLPGATTP